MLLWLAAATLPLEKGPEAGRVADGPAQPDTVGPAQVVCGPGDALPAEVVALLDADFDPAEKAAIYRQSHFFRASRHHLEEDPPQAVLIVGPRACSKHLGAIHAFKAGLFGPPDQASPDDAVMLDADRIRAEHKGYAAATAHGKSRGCVHRHASTPGLKQKVKDLKQNMMAAAVEKRQHVVLTSACTRLATCLAEVEQLKAGRYKVHLVVVYGAKAAVHQRALERAIETGVYYTPEKFASSLAAFLPLALAVDGRVELLETMEAPPWTYFSGVGAGLRATPGGGWSFARGDGSPGLLPRALDGAERLLAERAQVPRQDLDHKEVRRPALEPESVARLGRPGTQVLTSGEIRVGAWRPVKSGKSLSRRTPLSKQELVLDTRLPDAALGAAAPDAPAPNACAAILGALLWA